MSNNRLVVCRLVSSLEPLRHPVGCTPMKSSSSDIRWAYCDAGTSAPITLHQSMTLSRCGTSTHSSGSVAGSGQGRTCLLSPVTGVISRVHEFALPWIHRCIYCQLLFLQSSWRPLCHSTIRQRLLFWKSQITYSVVD